MVSNLSRKARALTDLGSAAKARFRFATGRPVRFAGAFPDREAALASLPTDKQDAYDRDDVADVSYEIMCQLAPWDAPVIQALRQMLLQRQRLVVLDAGGHMGTKFIAFGGQLPLERADWNVWDLPAILRAGRALQDKGDLTSDIHFRDHPADAGPVDVLLASGLLQYYDQPLGHLIDAMVAPPRWIILNKVATRPGDTVVTLEQIGPVRVPYQIRGEAGWEAEVASLGYTVTERWDNPSLSHRISTHPWLGQSHSKGYVLERPESG